MGREPLPQATFMITKRIPPAKTMRLLKHCAGWTFVALAALLALPGNLALAQESTLDKGPAPPYVEPAPPPEPPKPVFDPLRANKSIEVGTFYMKRGNYDAAIDRFHDAAEFEPGLAKSYLLLGEAYEHKGDTDSALAAYRKYLSL